MPKDVLLCATVNTFEDMVAKLIAIIVYAPILLVPSIIVVGLGVCLGNVYIKAQLSIKRELAARKAPVLAVFGSAMHGLGKYLGLV